MLFLSLAFFSLPCSYIVTSPFVIAFFHHLTFYNISVVQLLKQN